MKLYSIKNDSTCKFLYTMVPSGGNYFTYVVDGSTRPSDEENFSPIHFPLLQETYQRFRRNGGNFIR